MYFFPAVKKHSLPTENAKSEKVTEVTKKKVRTGRQYGLKKGRKGSDIIPSYVFFAINVPLALT